MASPNSQLGEIGNLIFLSYRRDDTAAQALALRFELETRLRAVQVFLDTSFIQGGDVWPKEIQKALSRAKVVIAVIGEAWSGGKTHPRRIDKSKDWVHKEIALALKEKQGFILPILIDGVTWEKIKLPDPLKRLALAESRQVRLKEWEKDIQEVAKTLKSKYGFKLKEDQIRLPPHDKVKELCPPFRWDDLEQVMTELQEGWQIEFSDDPVRPNHKRVELVRDFVFQSFEQAMEFMAGVGKFASESNHHPRWMNLWNTVRVWLSTWDVGSRITPLDTQLARYMEWKYDKIKFEHTPH